MSLAPSAALPSYLQTQPWQSSQNQLNQLPGQFNTSGLKASYGQQEAQNWSQGSALAAAAANQYVQRARQSGASTLGAGFAQASAMLPVYQQNADMNTQLQNQLLQYHTQQAQIGAGLSGDIGRLQSQNQSTLADYLTTQQKLQQSQSQYYGTFGQNQQQFNQSLAEKQREANLSYLASTGKSQQGFTGLMTTPGNGFGANAIQFSPQFQQYLKASGNNQTLLQGAPQYPQGFTSGQEAGYQGQLASLRSMANPGTQAYNQYTDSANPFGMRA